MYAVIVPDVRLIPAVFHREPNLHFSERLLWYLSLARLGPLLTSFASERNLLACERAIAATKAYLNPSRRHRY